MKHAKFGMSLVEMMVALLIFSTIITGVYGLGQGLSKLLQQNLVTLDFQSSLRTGMQKLTWHIRQFRSASKDADDENLIHFWYLTELEEEKSGRLYFNSSAKTISIQYDTDVPEIILTDIEDVGFETNISTNTVLIDNLKASYFDNIKNQSVDFNLNLSVQCQGLR